MRSRWRTQETMVFVAGLTLFCYFRYDNGLAGQAFAFPFPIQLLLAPEIGARFSFHFCVRVPCVYSNVCARVMRIRVHEMD